jgi:L-lactate dehydrogenase complex protein LldF
MSNAHAAFFVRTEKALADVSLQRLLDDVTGRFTSRREAAAQAVPMWEDFREHARGVKAATLTRLDEHLLEFERNVEARGGHVHWAPTAEQARSLVLQLARASGVRRVVKSKSMVSEEIHLNDFLEKNGIAAVETDLGEYIIQLAGERPSHIIAPAIHKSRVQISKLFEDKLGLADTGDVEQITAEARRRLRVDFQTATMGVSGANFGVAETGTIVIVENEGNARLTTTMPRLHVVLMGIEKVIPRVQDLSVFLTLLPRSATGQPMSAYVSFLSGPRRPDDLDGPEELHVILLDNGRSAMLGDPGTREVLQCIRCGACQNVCPVYRNIGGHAYGGVYAGPIGAIVSPFLDGAQTAGDLPFASTLCGACADVCPVKIRIPEVLLHLRQKVMAGAVPDEALPNRFLYGLGIRAWAAVMSRPWRYRLAGRVLRSLAGVLGSASARSIPGPLRAWTSVREAPVPSPVTFTQWWSRRGATSSPAQTSGVVDAS